MIETVSASEAFFAAIAVPAAVLDDSFDCIAVNPAFCERFGYLEQEIVNESVLRVYAPSVRAVTADNLNLMQALNYPSLQGDRHLVTRTGAKLDAMVSITKFAGPQADRYAMLFQDLRPSHDHENLRVSRSEMYRLMIDQSPVPISMQDENWRITLVNQAYCELVGYSASELIGKDPVEFLHSPDDQVDIPRQREVLKRSNLDELPRFSSIRELVHRNGQRIRYRLELGYSRGSDGTPLWCSLLIDLSRLHRAESALDSQVQLARQLMTRFQTFAISLSQGLLVVKPSTDEVLFDNGHSGVLLNGESSTLTGERLSRLWQNLTSPEQRIVQSALQAMRETGKGEAEVVVTLSDRTTRYLRIVFHRDAVFDVEYFVMVEDITEQRQLEAARLEQAVVQRDKIINEIHHRIKNHLQGTALFLYQAQENKPALASELSLVADQLSAIASVHGLIDPGTDYVPVDRVSAAIVDHLVNTQSMAIRCTHPATQTSAWQLPQGEATTFALVLTELLTNAIRHGSSGFATYSLIDSDSGVVCRVTNPGRLAGNPLHESDPRGGLSILKLMVPTAKDGFQLFQAGGEVVAEYTLTHPRVVKATA